MIDFGKLFKLLLRHKFTLIIIPVTTVIISYFLVRNLPDSYSSQAQIATGIIDETQKVLNEDNNGQEYQINQEFSNLIEMMKMPKMVDQVAYQLILHDLTSKTPFRKPSKSVLDLDASAKKHAIEVFQAKHKKREGLSLFDKDQNGIYSLLRSMGYDGDAIKQKLNIYRSNNSDFIYVEYLSENPELSAFVVNTLCTEFITYYTSLIKENQRKAVNFLQALLKEKYAAMNTKISLLRDYKIKNRVLNLFEQSKLMYTSILEYDSKKQQAEKEIISYAGAIKSIDSKFEPKDRRYLESTMTKVNQDIIGTKRRLQDVNQKYIQSGFSDAYKKSIDSLKNVLETQINLLTDHHIYNPLTAKQGLVTQKINLEIQLDIAKYSVASLGKVIADMNGQFDRLVPHGAVVQSFERDIDVASKEYLEILSKYNETNMESGYSIKLRQVQWAMPGLPLPSKKMLLVIISGIISFMFCAIILFVIFFLDDAITTAKELANKVDLPVFGELKLISGTKLDLASIWKGQIDNGALKALKDSLRSIRFEIDQELNDSAKTIGITSLNPGEGKTFFAVNLALAYSMINKKVLLIDGNFINPSISQTIPNIHFVEDILKGEVEPQFISDTHINILGNKGEDYSLLEISKEDDIKNKLAEFQSQFDVVITETASLETISKSKEWFPFMDKILLVFEANQNVSEAKKRKVRYLKSLNDKLIGLVLNKVTEAPPRKTPWYKKLKIYGK